LKTEIDIDLKSYFLTGISPCWFVSSVTLAYLKEIYMLRQRERTRALNHNKVAYVYRVWRSQDLF